MTTVPPGTSGMVEDEAVDAGGGAVLFPVLSGRSDGFAADVAGAIANARSGPLVLATTNHTTSSPSIPLVNDGSKHVERRTRLARRARAKLGIDVEEQHHHWKGPSGFVSEMATERSVDTVVVEQPPEATETSLATSGADRLDVNADCDVAVVSGSPQMGTVSSVLLAVAGGPHSWSAAGVAEAVGTTEGAWVDVMHVVSPSAGSWRRTRGQRIIGTAMDRLSGEADEWLYEADDVADVLVEQSRYYDLIVLGSPRKSRLREFVSGSTAREVRRDAGTAVITVRKAGERKSLLSQLVG